METQEPRDLNLPPPEAKILVADPDDRIHHDATKKVSPYSVREQATMIPKRPV